MKHKILIAFCLIAINVCSQPNSEIINYLDKKFPNLSSGYLIFFEPELIEYCNDSVHRANMVKWISLEKKWIAQGNPLIQKERKVFLSLLHARIKNTGVKTKHQHQSKEFILELLAPYKVDFVVDEKLLEARFNPKNRGLPFGDEECEVDFSFYTFFIYDPELYTKVLKSNKIANPTGKMTFPTTCFLEELSYVPLVMKKKIQMELLKILDPYQGQEYDVIRDKIKKANLNASYD